MMMRRTLSVALFALLMGQITLKLIATPMMTAPTVAAALPPNHSILVGPGFSDGAAHQLVRTNANVLYTVVPDCSAYPCAGTGYTGPPNALHAYRASTAGTPTGFNEVDAAHHPTGNIGDNAIAIDGTNTIHIVWLTTSGNGNIYYAPFDTTTNTWGPSTTLATTNWTNWENTVEGVTIAVDASGVPTVVYNSVGPDGILHLWFASAANGWQATRLDDVALPTNAKPQHPAMAFTTGGDIVIAYMVGTFNYVPDGVVYVRSRTNGIWGASIRINDSAMTTIDNGPSLLITPDGVQHLAFVNTDDEIRYWYNPGDGWLGDKQPPRQQTHNPSLGPDGNGGISIYGHGAPVGEISGHGDNLYFFHKAAIGMWEPWTEYAAGSLDCGVSTRWSQFFFFFPQTVDIAYWSDLEPYTLFLGSDPAPTAARFALTGLPAAATAGVPLPFTLTAQDTAAVATTYTGTVHFISSDPRAALPADYTFTAADNGAHTFSATLATAGAQSITAADTANPSLTATQTGIVITAPRPTPNPLPAPRPSTSPISGSTPAPLPLRR